MPQHLPGQGRRVDNAKREKKSGRVVKRTRKGKKKR